tara:strand:+ start:842 stop:1615 length:774 start_codon:yes stop_codon:yes gene_type:complete
MIYYLISKVIPLFLQPLGICILLIFSYLIFKRRILIILSVVLLLISSLGIVGEKMWRFLEYPYERISNKKVDSADAIVVLSGSRHPSPGSDKIAEWLDPDRFLAGISLFKDGKGSKLIFTGGSNPLKKGMKPESYYFKEEAINLGIPSASILTTKQVFNTYQESLKVKEIISKSTHLKRNDYKIILVTSSFHMKRAKKVFERQGLVVIPFPVDFQSNGDWAGDIVRNPLLWIPSAEGLHSTSRALREMLGRLIYRAW